MSNYNEKTETMYAAIDNLRRSAMMFQHVADEIRNMADELDSRSDVRKWLEWETTNGTMDDMYDMTDSACKLAEHAHSIINAQPYGIHGRLYNTADERDNRCDTGDKCDR